MIAAQLGTAFIGCQISSAEAGYRAALFERAPVRTDITSAIFGRPARYLVNQFAAFGAEIEPASIPDYPIAYGAEK